MNKYLCKIVTVQSNAIRILSEALKDILTDVNLQISKDGIKIIAMDGSKVAIINLKLDATKFEEFYCQLQKFWSRCQSSYYFLFPWNNMNSSSTK